jgi:hypothetical protein
MTIIECQLVGHVDWCSVRHWSILISMVWKTMELDTSCQGEHGEQLNLYLKTEYLSDLKAH